MCARTCSKSGNRCCSAVDSFCQEHRRSHILGQLVSVALLMSLFKVFPCLKSVRQVFQLSNLLSGKGFACCRLNCVRRPAGRTWRPIFAIAPGLAAFQPPRTASTAPPSVLETRKCCSSWPNSIVTPKSVLSLAVIGCLSFSTVFIACFNAG